MLRKIFKFPLDIHSQVCYILCRLSLAASFKKHATLLRYYTQQKSRRSLHRESDLHGFRGKRRRVIRWIAAGRTNPHRQSTRYPGQSEAGMAPGPVRECGTHGIVAAGRAGRGHAGAAKNRAANRCVCAGAGRFSWRRGAAGGAAAGAGAL